MHVHMDFSGTALRDWSSRINSLQKGCLSQALHSMMPALVKNHTTANFQNPHGRRPERVLAMDHPRDHVGDENAGAKALLVTISLGVEALDV